MLDFLGVKYIVTGFELDPAVFKKVFTAAVTPKNIPVYIFENEGALPKLYLLKNFSYLPENKIDMKNLLAELTENLVFYIECDNCPVVSGDSAGEIKILEEKNDYLKLEVNIKTPTWLIHSQNFLPGWSVQINSQPENLYRLNGLFMAVLVPAGKNEVEFEFHYPFFNLKK